MSALKGETFYVQLLMEFTHEDDALDGDRIKPGHEEKAERIRRLDYENGGAAGWSGTLREVVKRGKQTEA